MKSWPDFEIPAANSSAIVDFPEASIPEIPDKSASGPIFVAAHDVLD